MKNPKRGVEEIIQSAMQDGAFDNLPGRGEPLKLDPNQFANGDWDLAFHLLKQNGFAPEFIEIRKSIEEDLASARSQIKRAGNWRNQSLANGEDSAWVEAEWARAQNEFIDTLAALNSRIRDYNLVVPSQLFHRVPLNPKLEFSGIEQEE